MQNLRQKNEVKEHADRIANERERWIENNSYYYDRDCAYMRFLVPEGLRVLDVGCGTGRLLAEMRPREGVGVDFSQNMIDIACQLHPDITFKPGDAEDAEFMASLGGPFDVIILSDIIGLLSDCQVAFENLLPLCTPDTRIIVAYYSGGWTPLLRVAELLGSKMPQPEQNWLSTDDITNLLKLSNFEVVNREWRQLIPRSLLGLGSLVNRYIAPLPGIRRLCLRNYVVARVSPAVSAHPRPTSATVLVPCRNEKGNIEGAVQRIPDFCDEIEILFVEGGSSDGTMDEILRVIKAYPEKNIRVLTQDGTGKGDAVRKGFDSARNEVLMILDADLTMPPEELPKYFEALASGQGEFINGSRLVYPLEKDAMRFLNHIANEVFSWLFSWLLNQRFTDTLCGTKVLRKRDYDCIKNNRSYFGEFDPFGDFDLLFGAAKLNKKIQEVPIRYLGRSYGETQISRFRHGVLLLKMVIFAYRKLKAF